MKSPVLKGIVSALAFGAFLTAVAIAASSAPRTPIVSEPLVSLPSTFTTAALKERLGISATSTATSTLSVATSTAKAKTSKGADATALASTTPARTTPLVPQKQLDAAAARLSSALVNILCAPHADNPKLHAISGSGVIISPTGVIVTDAHIGQFLLFEHNVPATDRYDCVIRTGSPAENAYLAEPVFVSSAWIEENPRVITQTESLGTGEHDVALLGITGSATRKHLPSSFPYVPLARTAPDKGDQVIIASYGAQFLAASGIRSDLMPTVVYTTVKEVYTFVADTVDIVSLGGSIAAQEGSSGGGVVNANGEFVGLITTSTVKGDLTKRELRALSAPYVRRTVLRETGVDFDSYVAGDPASLADDYARAAKALAAFLVAQINQ